VELPRGTFSIVALDPENGDVGVAVQSKYFAVGAVVPWGRAGVGAVATQAAGRAAYGPEILDLLARGLEPAEAIERALVDDERRETRQLGVVDAQGRAAAFTGSACNEWAGHATGSGYAAQGNILAGEAVIAEMARAFERTSGALAERLLAALEAAQAAGGDRRGQQSAALVVERSGGIPASREDIDRIVDLRVDDHPEPIRELRRLLDLHTRMRLALGTSGLYERREWGAAIAATKASLERFPDDPLLLYNLACYESLDGRRKDALAHLGRALSADPTLRDIRHFLLAQDVLYVGGGNTANMLAIWRVHGVDAVLREAWERGIVLAGISAGSICWFEAGVTDSFGEELAPLSCLGFLSGSNCPHYDSEPQRRPAYRRLVDAGELPPGLAAEDGVGLHFVGTELAEAISARSNARAFRVGAGTEEAPPVRRLG